MRNMHPHEHKPMKICNKSQKFAANEEEHVENTFEKPKHTKLAPRDLLPGLLNRGPQIFHNDDGSQSGQFLYNSIYTLNNFELDIENTLGEGDKDKKYAFQVPKTLNHLDLYNYI